jgi:hypothetical protein
MHVCRPLVSAPSAALGDLVRLQCRLHYRHCPDCGLKMPPGRVIDLNPPLKVYVVECGVYAERYIAGVYRTLEAAKADWATGKDGWRDLSDNEWDNGLDMSDAVLITSFDVGI